jgi:hypothetical protein
VKLTYLNNIVKSNSEAIKGNVFLITDERHASTRLYCTMATDDSDIDILVILFNLLKPTGYVMHQQGTNSRTVCSAHAVFICFVFT